MAEYRYHPEIEGLRVNEDGSEVLLNDSPMQIKVQSKGTHPHKYIYYRGHKIALRKLILECWSASLAPNKTITAKPKNGDYTNYHHSNLEWGKVGGNPKTLPKFTPEQEQEVMQKVKAGVSVCQLARDYKVARNTIQKLIKRQEKLNTEN